MTTFPHADMIDSRDLHELREELAVGYAADTLDQEDTELYTTLSVLADEVEDWDHGVTFIAESYFENYARDLADDIGAIPDNVSWPLTCIDWEQAARELQHDYTAYVIDGTTYFVR